MSHSYECPSCGGTLDFTGARTAKCPYCDTVVQVPEALWQPYAQTQSVAPWKKSIAIFLVVTVVMPTCLGIAGTLLGIGGGILGALAPFILTLLAR